MKHVLYKYVHILVTETDTHITVFLSMRNYLILNFNYVSNIKKYNVRIELICKLHKITFFNFYYIFSNNSVQEFSKGFLDIYMLETRPSTVFYIMPIIHEMMQFCSLEMICKFSFWTLKSTFPEYMKRHSPLFYTFNEIIQQTFDKTRCGTTILTNNEILLI